MNSLQLNSIEIQNFRAFKNLQIKTLGRVNLIVGKNNVGKSSLLESIQIYARRNHVAIWELLANREEGNYPSEFDNNAIEQKLRAIKFLFHGRKNISQISLSARIGEVDNRYKQTVIEFEWRLDDVQEEVRPTLTIRSDANYPMVDSFDTDHPMVSDVKSIRCSFIPATGLGKKDIDLLWSRIALTDKEREVVRTLRIISPDIEAVGIISNPEMTMARTAIARLVDNSEPIPLQSMGDGISRLFYIALALIDAKDGFLLIDEIGSGLHYSVQFELWYLILSIAEHLNVQVFATTHNNDNIIAFQAALQKSKENGILIRLEKRGNEIVPILFDKKRLTIATREEIEVR